MPVRLVSRIGILPAIYWRADRQKNEIVCTFRLKVLA